MTDKDATSTGHITDNEDTHNHESERPTQQELEERLEAFIADMPVGVPFTPKQEEILRRRAALNR